jgi:hypothetical protein
MNLLGLYLNKRCDDLSDEVDELAVMDDADGERCLGCLLGLTDG